MAGIHAVRGRGIQTLCNHVTSSLLRFILVVLLTIDCRAFSVDYYFNKMLLFMYACT